MEPLERLLQGLEVKSCRVLRQPGGRLRAQCPSHEDKRPSLSIKWTGERVLIWCHAGCKQEDVLRALGLSWRDLHSFPPRPPQKRQIEAVYQYQDADGVVLAEKVRLVPKHFFWRVPDRNRPEGFRLGLSGLSSLPMYRRPDLGGAAEVLVVEGEKSVDRLRQLGFAATCAPSGAGSWPPRFTAELARLGVASVVILPDADVPGSRHAHRVAESVFGYSNGVTMSAKILTLSGLPYNADVVDWLDAGGTADELRRRIQAAPIWFPGQVERQQMERRRKQNADRQRRFRAKRRMERLIATA